MGLLYFRPANTNNDFILIIDIMSQALCSLHHLPADLLCALPSCRAQLCPHCFQQHHASCGHTQALLVGEVSVGFFVRFAAYLIETVQQRLAFMTKEGFQAVFVVNSEHSRLSFSPSSSEEIGRVCAQVLGNYLTLLQNNRDFVCLNKDNLPSLINPQFLHDISSLFLEPWEAIGRNLIEQAKGELARSFPYRYSYRSLKFSVHPSLLQAIQSKKEGELLAMRRETFISIGEMDRLKEMARIGTRVGDAKIAEQIRAVSQNLKFVDSFQQILDSSFLNCDLTLNQKMILQESVETLSPLSPHFLSPESLERHIEELLIENQRLKEENCHLRFENQLLAEENMTLKGRE